MLPSEFQTGRSHLGRVGVGDNLAAECIDDDFSDLSNGYARIGQDYWYSPNLFLFIEDRISRAKTIGKTLPEPTGDDLDGVLRHYFQRFWMFLLLVHFVLSFSARDNSQ